MTFRQFAFKNVLRNKRLYIAYFLSSLFTVMVFFTFAIFAFHPALADIHKNALIGMGVAGGIIYVFSFFFILYSMSAFLQSRKKEFGLLLMLGASDRQIRWMVFLENMFIGIASTVAGILSGLLFAKAILLIAENVLIIDESLYFYFPTMAIIVTLVSFVVLFFFISILVTFILRTSKLVDLVKGDKQSKGEPKASIILSILAALLLVAGYVTAMYAKGAEVIFVMIPVVIVVILGTYLLFTQLSVYIIRLLKKNKLVFWHKTNMLLFSDLSFRMKDNARTFFMVAIISTVAFSAVGTLFGFHAYLTKGVKEYTPYAITYTPFGDDTEEEIEQDIEQLHTILKEKQIKAQSAQMTETNFEINNVDSDVLVVKASDYNNFARLIGEKEVHPSNDEALIMEQGEAMITQGPKASEQLKKGTIPLQNGEVIKPSDVIHSSVLYELNGAYIVSDDSYAQLGTPTYSDVTVAIEFEDLDTEKVIQIGERLEETLQYKAHYVDYTLYQIEKGYGPVLFIGLFIGLVFFVSAGSFLYFRVFTDFEAESQKFRSISRIGLTDQELSKVLTKQLAILFFSPILVALIHGAVALTALSHMFDYNLVTESAIVLGSFAVIQVAYFFIARYFYVKQVKRNMV